ncbi:MAG: MFS transporter, partial [Actinomadura sp.]
PHGKRGFYGAFPQMGAPAGTGLATIAFFFATQLSPDRFEAWGWRLPFLFSAFLVAVGLVIRLTIAESPGFEAVRRRAQQPKMPLVDAWRRHPREILLIAGTYLSQGVYAYLCMSFLVSYATKELGVPRPPALLGVFAAAVVATLLYPVFGALADRWGRKTVYLLGATAMLVAIVPVFVLINTGSPLAFGLAIVLLFGIAMAPAGGVTGSLFSLVFTPEVRYSGASVGYTISQICGPAFAPTIATALYAIDHSSGPVVCYLLVVGAVSVVSVLLLPGRLGRPEPYGTADRASGRTAGPATRPEPTST